MLEQQHRVALVTGAGRGIGKAILQRLLKAGVVVIGVDRNAAGVQSIDDEIKGCGGVGEGMTMDVTSPESIKGVVKSIEERYGSISILINNAGVTRDTLLMRMSQEDWDLVIATNLTAVFQVSQACIRTMLKARWGRIVNIASVVGFSGNAGQTNYAATKAGVVGLSKSLALEVASRNITVNCVAPGFIDTDMTKKLTDDQRAKLLELIPMGRMGSIEEVASAVEFLVSDQAAYITGSTIHLNGGMYMA